MSSYWRLLRIRGACALWLTGLIARMPMAMYSLGTVLMITALKGNYALAGGLSAAGLVGGGVVLTKVASWADRYGPRRVLIPQALVFAGLTAAFVVAAQARAPQWCLYITGTIAASALPALGAIVRSAWSALCAALPESAEVPHGTLVGRAFALESSTDDVIFIVGPALTAFLVTREFPGGGLAAAAALALAGIVVFVRQPSVGASRARNGGTAGPGHNTGGWTLPAHGLAALAPVLMLTAAATSAVEISTVAYAGAHGNRSLAGLILAGAAVGSCAGGLWYGARKWRQAEHVRFAAALVLSALGTAALRFAPGLPLLSLNVLLLGICIAPTLIGGYSILERQARPGRETEALSWVGFCNCAGAGAGSAVTGWAVDAGGAAGGFLAATGFAILAAVVCLAALPAMSKPGRHASAPTSGGGQWEADPA
jgi:MFS family permease